MSDSSLSGSIEFIKYQKPTLLPGDYQITIKQKVKADDKIDEEFSATQAFSVYGPRFELTPQDIHSVFPPPGSRGDHNNVLPHIIFNRSTLPWERDIWANKDSNANRPWFALLVFYQEEIEAGKVLEPKVHQLSNLLVDADDTSGKIWLLEKDLKEVELSIEKKPAILKELEPRKKLAELEIELNQIQRELKTDDSSENTDSSPKAKKEKRQKEIGEEKSKLEQETPNLKGNRIIWMRQFELEQAQHRDDKVTVIDVEQALLASLLTTAEDLQYLAHVRKSNLIQAGQENSTNLETLNSEFAVLIANRLPKNNSTTTVHLVSLEDCYADDKQFQYLQNLGNHDFVRLVSLKSWSFACLEPKYSFQGLLTHLNGAIPNQNSQNIEVLLRLPAKNFNSSLEKYLSKGYVPLPHSMRKGDRTISWYHSPFIPWKNTKTTYDKPIQVSDQLLHYDPETGLFDVSYAAAWQLGRLLALQDKRLSVSLYNWKRAHLRNHHQCNQFDQCSHLLPQASAEERSKPVPVSPEDQDWFQRLNRLEDVPFNYLVPDERMLPVESIRFFWVDPLWVDCLLKGAFSIGETIELTHLNTCQSLAENRHQQMTGFLLRSEVVAGYPGLLVDGYDSPGGNKLQLLRMDRLSENILLCLFEGEVKRADIYQKPDTLHFGFNEPSGAIFSKDLKDPKTGNELPRNSQNTVSINDPQAPLLKDNNVIRIRELALKMNSTDSSQFAIQMVEGTPLIIFKLAIPSRVN